MDQERDRNVGSEIFVKGLCQYRASLGSVQGPYVASRLSSGLDKCRTNVGQ